MPGHHLGEVVAAGGALAQVRLGAGDLGVAQLGADQAHQVHVLVGGAHARPLPLGR